MSQAEQYLLLQNDVVLEGENKIDGKEKERKKWELGVN